MPDVPDIDVDAKTVTSERSLRVSGSSTVVTIPPEIVDAVDWEKGDPVQVIGDWKNNEIRVKSIGED